MRVTVDADRRIVLPTAKPGDEFEVRAAEGGAILLAPVGASNGAPASVKMEKRGEFTVGVLARPIDPEALRDAMSEFP